MWVLGPISPSFKYAIAYCENCSNYIPKVKWTNEMDSSYQSLKQGLATPARLYRGLIVFPLTVLLVIITAMLFVKYGNAKKQDNTTLINDAIVHPHHGDIFQITHTDGTNVYYTYFRVAGSKGDSIYFNPSKVHLKDIKAWDDIPTNNSAYEPQQVGFSIKESQAKNMFVYNTQPIQYGMVWSLWKDGKLYKKY
jgi:hypothetical protein